MPDISEWHPLEWDSTKVARLWNYTSQSPKYRDVYFSKQVGLGVVRFLGHVVDLKQQVLDYGCGPGYLTKHLLAAGASCEGLDFSPSSVESANQRLAGNPNWKGAQVFNRDRLPFADSSFDLIVCLETIEHVLPEDIDYLLSEFRRILKPNGGKLLLTTPNDEDLAENSVFCPECSSVFHKWQQVVSRKMV